MIKAKSDTLAKAATLGVVAGLRSQLPLALLSLSAQHRDTAGPARPGVLRSPAMAALLVVSATGEIVVDKLPSTPSRLLPGSLIVRAAIGSLAGALLSRRGRNAVATGAACGGIGALAGSYAGYHLRRGLGRATGLPDPFVAVLEDSVAVCLGGWAVGWCPQCGEPTQLPPHPSRT